MGNYSVSIFEELKLGLLTSTDMQRRLWAKEIVSIPVSLTELSPLLFEERQLAMRYLWLLTHIGEISPHILHEYLPCILQKWEHINVENKEASLANFWRVAGIPIQNEAHAISLLFNWLQGPEYNGTTKSRALFVLLDLTQKYPELKNELQSCLEGQLDKSTGDFRKRVVKILAKLHTDRI